MSRLPSYGLTPSIESRTPKRIALPLFPFFERWDRHAYDDVGARRDRHVTANSVTHVTNQIVLLILAADQARNTRLKRPNQERPWLPGNPSGGVGTRCDDVGMAPFGAFRPAPVGRLSGRRANLVVLFVTALRISMRRRSISRLRNRPPRCRLECRSRGQPLGHWPWQPARGAEKGTSSCRPPRAIPAGFRICMPIDSPWKKMHRGKTALAKNRRDLPRPNLRCAASWPRRPGPGSRQNTRKPAAVERDFVRLAAIAGKMGAFDELGVLHLGRSTAQNLASVATHPRKGRFPPALVAGAKILGRRLPMTMKYFVSQPTAVGSLALPASQNNAFVSHNLRRVQCFSRGF